MVLAFTSSSPLSRLGNIISFMVKALHLGLLVFSSTVGSGMTVAYGEVLYKIFLALML